MTPADALAWLAGVASAMSLFASVRANGLQQRRWLLLQAALLALAVSGVMLHREELSYASALGWVLFVLAPGLAVSRQVTHAQAQRFAEAARWSRILGWLRPFNGVSAQATYYEAQAQVHAGQFERARELFTQLAQTQQYADVAQVELLRLERAWQKIVDFVEQERPDRWQVLLPAPYLRALGELGEVSRMLERYGSLPQTTRRLPGLRLLVTSLSGQPESVRQLLTSTLSNYGKSAGSYWLGTAEQRAGNLDAASELLRSVLQQGSLVPQAEQRLREPLAPVDVSAFSDSARSALSALKSEIVEERTQLQAQPKARKPVATLASGAVLVAIFLLRYVDGWGDVEGLVRQGALVLPPELIGGGAAWRVVAAGFLHFNATHLLMNLLGLWVLGRDLEHLWGRAALVGCLLGSSIGAYASALWFMPASLDQPRVLLGASAGVLGLVGALAAFSAIGYWRAGNHLFAQRLRSVGSIVAIQLLFDASTPQVSTFLHATGFVCGALLAAPFSLAFFARRPIRTETSRLWKS